MKQKMLQARQFLFVPKILKILVKLFMFPPNVQYLFCSVIVINLTVSFGKAESVKDTNFK